MSKDIEIHWQLLFPETVDSINNDNKTNNIDAEALSEKNLDPLSLITEELFYLQQLVSELVTKKHLHESLECYRSKGTKLLLLLFTIIMVFDLVVNII